MTESVPGHPPHIPIRSHSNGQSIGTWMNGSGTWHEPAATRTIFLIWPNLNLSGVTPLISLWPASECGYDSHPHTRFQGLPISHEKAGSAIPVFHSLSSQVIAVIG